MTTHGPHTVEGAHDVYRVRLGQADKLSIIERGRGEYNYHMRNIGAESEFVLEISQVAWSDVIFNSC